jgi:CheY-like chemotaxis protein
LLAFIEHISKKQSAANFDNMSTRILIVDDDEDDCDLLIDAIGMIDPAFVCAKVFNGKKAMELLSTGYRPDFIFLDLNMPIMDGRKCLIEIRKSRSLLKIPVIICSTSKRQSDIDETHRLGADSFITKPNSLIELSEQISLVLNKEWKGMSHRSFV